MRSFLLSFLLACASCENIPGNSVRVQFLADPSARLEALQIIWGGGKSSMIELAGGDAALLWMHPGNGSLLHVTFEMDGKQRYWNRDVTPTESGRRNSLQVWVGDRGDVDEKHCFEPCEYTLPWYEPWLSSLKVP